MTGHRYPLRDLLVAANITRGDAPRVLAFGGPEYRRWSDEGMTREVAERKALKAGLHPYTVWPEMVDHDDAERSAAQRAAAARRKRRQYSRRRDEILERSRRYREEARGALAVKRRRRYEQNAEAERERSHRYYEANRERMKQAARDRRGQGKAA
jgi:hypothetical protein